MLMLLNALQIILKFWLNWRRNVEISLKTSDMKKNTLKKFAVVEAVRLIIEVCVIVALLRKVGFKFVI